MNQLQIAFLREEYFRYATSDQGLDAETLAQFIKGGYPEVSPKKLFKGVTRILKNYGTDGVIHFDELIEFYELSYENQAEKVMKEFEKRGWKPPEKKKNRRHERTKSTSDMFNESFGSQVKDLVSRESSTSSTFIIIHFPEKIENFDIKLRDKYNQWNARFPLELNDDNTSVIEVPKAPDTFWFYLVDTNRARYHLLCDLETISRQGVEMNIVNKKDFSGNQIELMCSDVVLQ